MSAPGCVCGDPPLVTATVVGGTDPTGMHSCFILFFKNVFVKAPNHQMLFEWHSKMCKIYHVIYLATNGGYRESLISTGV